MASQAESRNEKFKTYQPALLQEIVSSSTLLPKRSEPAASDLVSPGSAAFSSWAARKAAQRALLEAQAHDKEAAFKAAMQQAKQAQVTEARDGGFQALYDEVLCGLVNSGTGIMADVQEMLQQNAAMQSAKRAALYQQWNSQVFDKMQQRIRAGMERTTIQQYEASLQTASNEYIKATNSKPCFLDMISPTDYDPLKLTKSSIQVSTGDLMDPLKKDLLKTQAEKALLATSNSGSTRSGTGGRLGSGNTLAKATVRPTLEVQRWASGQINATPYGHCIDNATALYTIKAADPQGLAQTASQLHMDDFTPPSPLDPYKPGKHMVEPAAHGNKQHMFDILQGSCQIQPGVTAGDAWLEAKGKKFVHSPEVAKGRHSLAEVLAHGSTNPYQDGRALDDAWLQPSGKHKVPGPEQRRGRKDLGEILQQSSNPYVDGRSLGDAWLEAKGKKRVPPGGM